jgi:hypothetical protein
VRGMRRPTEMKTNNVRTSGAITERLVVVGSLDMGSPT